MESRGRGALAWTVAFLLLIAISGCGAGQRQRAVARAALPASYVPLPFGRGVAFRPPSLGAAAARGRPIAGMVCGGDAVARYGVHLELFDRRRVVSIPAGIGVAPPRVRSGAYVRGGRCSYPLRTVESTGVIEVAAGSVCRLGDFFAVWGQPLARGRVLSFRGPLAAFVDGRAWRGDPRAIPLTRHAQIVIEVAGAVVPHSVYRFAGGL